MIYLTKEDYFEVYLGSMISSNDRDTLFMLYQPIIGHDAIALYFSLYAEFKKQDISTISTHEDLLESMSINITALQEARRLLEGIGLLQTYHKTKDNQNFYKYRLFAPKDPADFFNDVLFKGLLVRSLGAKKANRLANIYKSKDFNIEGYNEISESFVNVFHPDLDSNSFNTNVKTDKTYKHKTKDITKDFDKGEFLKYLENNHNILTKNIKKKDLEQISKISLLYGIEEVVAADYVSQSIDINGKIDFENVKQLSINDQNYAPLIMNKYKSKENYEGKGLKAKKIQLMSSMSAFDYLKVKQNNAAVSPSDLLLIDILANDYGLNSQVINPLIDYVLENYDNSLPRNLVLKIAGSLVRNQIQTTIDAMNYLYKVKKASKNQKKDEKSDNKSDVTDDDIKALLDDIGDN